MIVFDLKCTSQGHVFEAWFGSSEAFEEQRGRGLVECPLCGSRDVAKAVMAPRVGPKGNRGGAATEAFSSDPEAVKAMMASIAETQKKMLEGSDFVGDRFADEARAIHLGEADARSIHGQATKAQTDSLIEDGIKVAPLPFPVVEPSREN
ncbi:DUF1178 family protein [Allosphingosinicella sp.]|uniref:DUF1178 family protein n=1 Tax=Allosphingosinicella sp. TaxID=2823234 RepID=UPI002FC254B2